MQNVTMQLNYIANASVPSSSGRTLAVIDPSDGQPFDEIQRSNADDIDAAVHAARQCYQAVWQRLAPVDRGRLLQKLSAKVLEHADELTALEQRDCGKPTKQAGPMPWRWRATFESMPGACDKLHGEAIPYLDGYSVLTWREPHGVTGHIIPVELPVQIFGRSVGGALAAGDVCVVKPAEDACLSLIRVAQLAAEVGFPPGRRHRDGLRARGGRCAGTPSRALTTSASPAAPRWARSFSRWLPERHCPVTLELGGKSPQIIFADARPRRRRACGAQRHRPETPGQTCSAGWRVLIDSLIYEPLLERLGHALKSCASGPAAMRLWTWVP